MVSSGERGVLEHWISRGHFGHPHTKSMPRWLARQDRIFEKCSNLLKSDGNEVPWGQVVGANAWFHAEGLVVHPMSALECRKVAIFHSREQNLSI